MKKTSATPNIKLNAVQKKAFKLLQSSENIFLTGSAGTGKSFVIREYLKSVPSSLPILASTGAAAVLVGGRTFHSYFGLGIMEGGIEATVKRALKASRLKKRLKSDTTIIIDEISMIHPEAFEAAHLIAQEVRKNNEPFGGLRLIVVGDFFQLPPISVHSKNLSWLFEHPLWQSLQFKTVELTQPMRTSDTKFINILNQLRYGQLTKDVHEFLNQRVKSISPDFEGTVLFGRKFKVEQYNLDQLNKIKGESIEIPTEIYQSGKFKKEPSKLIALTPLPEVLVLKKNALVMLRKNDPLFRFVNGSLGRVKDIGNEKIKIELLEGHIINLSKEDFQILDADGEVQATVTNFPISLAWASTIHKAQGASIDRIHIDLKDLWEYGQAYVAISRATSPDGLFIENWRPQSIKANPSVVDFYQNHQGAEGL